MKWRAEHPDSELLPDRGLMAVSNEHCLVAKTSGQRHLGRRQLLLVII
jgi:hypothetical protein